MTTRDCALIGRWRIVEPDLWGRDDLDLLGPATIAFDGHGHGEITVGALTAALRLEYARTTVFFNSLLGFTFRRHRLMTGQCNAKRPSARPGSASTASTTWAAMSEIGLPMVKAAIENLSIAYIPEPAARPFLDDGRLVALLEDRSPAIRGLRLYYSGHRHVPAALRALIDVMKAAGSSAAQPKSPRAYVRPYSPSSRFFGASKHALVRTTPCHAGWKRNHNAERKMP